MPRSIPITAAVRVDKCELRCALLEIKLLGTLQLKFRKDGSGDAMIATACILTKYNKRYINNVIQ